MLYNDNHNLMLRVPVGGDAELECRILNLGDFMQVWKNGTRVISVGSLQVISSLRILMLVQALMQYNITKMTCLCSLLEFKLYLELVLSKYVYTDIRFYIVNIKIQFYVICSPQIIFVVKLIIQDGQSVQQIK